MSEITRAFEFVIMAAGSTSTADLTFDDDDIAEPPAYGTWDVKPLECEARSLPFDVKVLDTSEQVTAALSDSGGRADLMGRFWRLRVNENGGGLTTVATGRIVGIELGRGLVSYVFKCGDELYLMRQAQVFTDLGDADDTVPPTTQIWPPGFQEPWRQFPQTQPGRLEVESTDSSRSDTNKAVHLVAMVGSRLQMSRKVVQWIKDDLKENVQPGATGTTTGHFDHLRFRTSGADYEVLSFAVDDSDPDIFGSLDFEDPAHLGTTGTGTLLNLWVAWNTSQPTAGDFINGYLYAANAPVSEVVPFHRGGANADGGIDPFDYLKDLMDAESLEYDSNAFSTWDASTNPDGLIANPLIPKIFPRFTEPMTLWDLAKRFMQPVGLAPFQNSTGQFMPRFVLIPRGITVSGTEIMDEDDFTIDGHPTWQQRGSEIVTELHARFNSYDPVTQFNQDDDWPADKLFKREREIRFEHDRIANLGRHTHVVDMWDYGPALATQLKTELFDRYGDGPIYGVGKTLSAGSAINPGDPFRIDLPSYPDLATQARGGIRLVQAMRIEQTVGGRIIEYLDAGSDDAALTAPSVSIAKNATRPKFDVDVTISSLPAAADGYQLQLKVGSLDWYTAGEGSANETVTITGLPSNTTIQARVGSTANGRVRSAWSATSSVALDAMTAPSSVSATISGTTAVLTWTNGESLIRPQVMLDGAPYFFGNFLKPGHTRLVLKGLTASTSYNFGVRHADPYGGVSTTTTDTQSTGTAGTLTAPYAAINRQPATMDDIYPDDLGFFGIGIEVGVIRTDPDAGIEIEYDTSSGFSTAPRSVFLRDRDVARIALPDDDTTRYVRARHWEDGFTASAWTETITMKPRPFATITPTGMRDQRDKVMFISAHQFNVKSAVAGTNVQYNDGYLTPVGTTTRDFAAPVVLPVGSIVTQVRFRTNHTNSGDQIVGAFIELDDDPTAAVTTVGSDTVTTVTGLQYATISSLTKEIAADKAYAVTASITNNTATGDLRLAYVEINYTSPDPLSSL